jgi:predicted ATP-dependent serine protease
MGIVQALRDFALSENYQCQNCLLVLKKWGYKNYKGICPLCGESKFKSIDELYIWLAYEQHTFKLKYFRWDKEKREWIWKSEEEREMEQRDREQTEKYSEARLGVGGALPSCTYLNEMRERRKASDKI